MYIFVHLLDLSIVLISSKVVFFRVEELSVPFESLKLNRIDGSHDVPVHIFSARRLGDCTFIDPAVFVVHRVKCVTDPE